MESTDSTKKEATDTECNPGPNPEDDDLDWDLVGYITASKHRTQVLEELDADGPTTPTRISSETGLAATHVSRALTDLADRDLAEVLNPDARKGRLYDSTNTGSKVIDAVEEVTA